jgi:hypothetical protein
MEKRIPALENLVDRDMMSQRTAKGEVYDEIKRALAVCLYDGGFLIGIFGLLSRSGDKPQGAARQVPLY